MFFDAMYGQEDPDTFVILKPAKSSTAGYVYLTGDSVSQEDIPNYVFEQRITSESPNLITQLCVRLQFRLPRMYPVEPPIIGCKSLVGASKQQCTELLQFLADCARERVGQVMLFDLVLAAGEWLSARVREGHQGSLHESMLETQRIKVAEADKKTEQTRLVSEAEQRAASTLHDLTPQRETELRRQWLQSHDTRGTRAGEPVTFAGNLSYTMSRFIKTQGPSQFKPSGGAGSNASSLLQTVHILQQGLVQQQTLVAHLLAQWLSLTKTLTGSDSTGPILDYLRSERLLDEKQSEMVQFPGRIPLNALFPNADGSVASVNLLSTPAERLSGKLSSSLSTSLPLRTIASQPSLTGQADESPMGAIVKTSRYQQDFEEISYCGSGSFGDVMKVRNRLDGIYYAVKRVRIGRIRGNASEELVNNKIVNRILREVTTLGRIQSPYVLRYHQAWIEESNIEDDDDDHQPVAVRMVDNLHNHTLRSGSFFEGHNFSPSINDSSGALLGSNSSSPNVGPEKQLSLYIQTAFCPRTLSDYLEADGGSASASELWRLCRMMLEGLAHIHSHGILHRDMKPSNIFIDSNGDIRIGDFGLATFDTGTIREDYVDDGKGANVGVDHSRNIGTKLYCSPEQEGEADTDYDERTDVYSLGVIFFELWHPFRTNNERIEQILKLKEGLVPGKFAESHPRQWRLITTMMKKNVIDRPTATSLLQSDLLPPRMEDDFLNDALRVVANPNTPVFPRILQKLFSPDRQSVLSKPGGRQPVAQSIAQYLTYLPEPVVMEQRKEWISAVFREIFERHGAVRVATPLFSSIVPESKLRDDESTLMDHNGSLLGLRYDSRNFFCQTMAEAFANPHSALRPEVLFKRYDLGGVFRKPTRSGMHPHQLLRADFDVVGVDPVAAEAECICLVSEVVESFKADIQWVRVRLNHRLLFGFVLDQADVSAAARAGITRAMLEPALSASSSARAERWESVRKALALAAMGEKQINSIGRWFRTSTGAVEDAVSALRDHIEEESEESDAIGQIEALMKMLDRVLGSEFREKEFMLDLCSPPPSDDYDGIYFRVDVSFNSHPDLGESVAVGGRLDSALGKHPGSSGTCQMAGLSWSVSKFVANITVPPSGILSAPDVLVCSLYDAKNDEGATEEYSMRTEQVGIASDLWRSGVSADVFYGTNSLQEQLEFASARGVKYVVLVRERDLQSALGCEARRSDEDYNVSLRVLVGTKGKQLKEQIMRRSEVVHQLAHSR